PAAARRRTSRNNPPRACHSCNDSEPARSLPISVIPECLYRESTSASNPSRVFFCHLEQRFRAGEESTTCLSFLRRQEPIQCFRQQPIKNSLTIILQAA